MTYRRLKIIGLFLPAIISILSLPASAEVEWLSKEYDFGRIKEEDGAVSGSVRFVNKGTEATYINRVRPSCGCTGATFTTSMIEPGDTATISFTFNPHLRPGIIDKTIKVYTGPMNDMSVIHLTGTVMASRETLETGYPVECGPLRLENKILLVGELVKGVSRHVFLNVYNQGEKTIRPTWKKDEKGVKVSLVPEELGPGEIGTFSIKVDTGKMNKEGRFEIPLEIKPDKDSSDSVIITLNGTIVDDSQKISFGKEEKGKNKKKN